MHQRSGFDPLARFFPQVVCSDFLEFGINQRNCCIKGATVARMDPLKKFREFHEPNDKHSTYEDE